MAVAVQIVDTDTGAKALSAWVDVKGQSADAPANAAPLVYSSDAPGVATVATDPTNPLQGDIAEVAVGNFNVVVAPPTDTSGNPLLEADGTPMPGTSTPAQVIASAATGLLTTVSA